MTGRRWVTNDVEETRALGRELAEELLPDGIAWLRGGLGSGKTVLAQGIAEGLGIPARQVCSPTFTILQHHQGRAGNLLHADLYRLGPGEFGAIGLEEALAGPGVKVVEWGDRWPGPRRPRPGEGACLLLEIRPRSETGREIVEVGTMTNEENDSLQEAPGVPGEG